MSIQIRLQLLLQLKNLFGADVDMSLTDSITPSAAPESPKYTVTRGDSADTITSSVGTAIKLISVVVIILSIIGSVVVMISVGFSSGAPILIATYWRVYWHTL